MDIAWQIVCIIYNYISSSTSTKGKVGRRACQSLWRLTFPFQIEKQQNGEIEIKLTPHYSMAARLYHLLYEAGGSILLGSIDGMYFRKYGEVLRPANFGAASLNALLGQFPFLVVIKGRRNKRNVTLNADLTCKIIIIECNRYFIYWFCNIYGCNKWFYWFASLSSYSVLCCVAF